MDDDDEKFMPCGFGGIEINSQETFRFGIIDRLVLDVYDIQVLTFARAHIRDSNQKLYRINDRTYEYVYVFRFINGASKLNKTNYQVRLY